jgi:hypothetical protein
MSSYEATVGIIAAWVFFYGIWKIMRMGGGFFAVLGFVIFMAFAYGVAVGIPRFIAD